MYLNNVIAILGFFVLSFFLCFEPKAVVVLVVAVVVVVAVVGRHNTIPPKAAQKSRYHTATIQKSYWHIIRKIKTHKTAVLYHCYLKKNQKKHPLASSGEGHLSQVSFLPTYLPYPHSPVPTLQSV
jgi:hypothetical protein